MLIYLPEANSSLHNYLRKRFADAVFFHNDIQDEVIGWLKFKRNYANRVTVFIGTTKHNNFRFPFDISILWTNKTEEDIGCELDYIITSSGWASTVSLEYKQVLGKDGKPKLKSCGMFDQSGLRTATCSAPYRAPPSTTPVVTYDLLQAATEGLDIEDSLVMDFGQPETGEDGQLLTN